MIHSIEKCAIGSQHNKIEPRFAILHADMFEALCLGKGKCLDTPLMPIGFPSIEPNQANNFATFFFSSHDTKICL